MIEKNRIGSEEIEKRFGKHPATIEGPNALEDQHDELRDEFVDFVTWVDELLPKSREKSLVMTHLEIASMYCHKGLYA